MSTVNDKDAKPGNAPISTGAGIAIAGIWLGGSAVTITLLLITFVFSKPTNASAGDGWVVLLLLASPMIAAYFLANKLIPGKK